MIHKFNINWLKQQLLHQSYTYSSFGNPNKVSFFTWKSLLYMWQSMYSTGSKNTLGNRNTFHDNDCTELKRYKKRIMKLISVSYIYLFSFLLDASWKERFSFRFISMRVITYYLNKKNVTFPLNITINFYNHCNWFQVL